MSQHEHEFEAAHGLPEALPANEHLLWQGAPDWRTLSREALHIRKVAIYFAVLVVWRAVDVLASGGTALEAIMSSGWLMPLAALALGLMMLFAWLMSRTTVYTLTDRRLVMRIGIVLSVTFNLPHRMIESASLRTNSDGTGDISLALLASGDRIAYLHLWPHARPWKVRRTEPMLRALPDAARVAQMLTDAVEASAGCTRLAPAAVPATDRQAAPAGRGQAVAA